MNDLVIDIGNTRIKAALVDENGTITLFQRKKLSLEWLKMLFSQHDVQRVVLCSVQKDKEIWIEWLQKNSKKCLIFNYELPLPIKIAYTTPETLGKDRLAAVLGAWLLFPNQNTLVIDAGTCIKYDIVTAEGLYLGGSIAPGIAMRLRAMHEFTAKLPLIKPEIPLDEWIGNSTETAIRTGAQRAAAFEANGFIAAYRQRFENLNVVLTGGDTIYLKPHIENIITDKFLIIKGLHSVL